jgi:chromosome segregation protein
VGAVDYGVLAEFAVVSDRYRFLTEQLDDLVRTEATIREGMAEARERMRTQFVTAFESVNERFKEMFRELFRGGDAELLLSGDPESTQCGIDIAAQPPGKRLHRLATLSGGERSLVGAALLLALISVNPSPFCMLDEVDAALDETNVQRFVATIREMSHSTQFVLVTHNRATMEMADALYGVTMNPGAVSQVVSVRLEAVVAP